MTLDPRLIPGIFLALVATAVSVILGCVVLGAIQEWRAARKPPPLVLEQPRLRVIQGGKRRAG